MPKYAVYAIATASKFIGEFEADNEEQAKEMANDSGDYHMSLCHQCAHKLDIGDVYDEQVEEVG